MSIYIKIQFLQLYIIILSQEEYSNEERSYKKKKNNHIEYDILCN